ncbi:MAG: DNA cytosine methyltransferase [Synergistales bacterium]
MSDRRPFLNLKNLTNLTVKPEISAVDLFCGAGGLTYGLENAGIDVRLGIDLDPACEFPYSRNNRAKFCLKPIENVEGETLQEVLCGADIKLIAGCAPCQTFSTYNQKATSEDSRWWLLLQFARLVEETRPDLVTMENVPGLRQRKVFESFVGTLEKLGYHIFHDLVECGEYGIPQRRTRLVLLASKRGPISLLPPESFARNRTTVRQTIGELPQIGPGEAHPRDPFHKASRLSPLNMKRMQASIPGGSWKDWDETLVANCHRKTTGRSYPSVYGRMEWDDLSPTITTEFFGFGSGRFGHPEQDRALSLREGALLQSFPRTYEFTPPEQTVSMKVAGRLVGNAVPPILGEAIGRSLLEHVSKNR